MTTRSLVIAMALVFLAAVTAATTAVAQPARSSEAPAVVVVELFTSEGCSSCPPADALLARLDESLNGSGGVRGRRRPLVPRNVEVIALGEHVDYWDNLGWKDRFSSPLFTARQQDYGMALRKSSVYTPQAVINGVREVIGSDMRALTGAIREAAHDDGEALTADVEIHATQDDDVALHVGLLPAGSHGADVLLAVTESGIATDVGAGENNGRHLVHAAVVRTMSRLAELDPKHPGEYQAEARLNLRPEWNRARLKAVLLVQDRETRRILGAAAVGF